MGYRREVGVGGAADCGGSGIRRGPWVVSCGRGKIKMKIVKKRCHGEEVCDLASLGFSRCCASRGYRKKRLS